MFSNIFLLPLHEEIPSKLLPCKILGSSFVSSWQLLPQLWQATAKAGMPVAFRIRPVTVRIRPKRVFELIPMMQEVLSKVFINLRG
jgi:hypothetical protein